MKSTHQLINPKQITITEQPSFVYDKEKKRVVKKEVVNTSGTSGTVNTITNVQTGSNKGIAMRTSVYAQEDLL